MATKSTTKKPAVKTTKAKSGKPIKASKPSELEAMAMKPPPSAAELDARQNRSKTQRKASGPERKTAAVEAIKATLVPPILIKIK